MVIWIAHEFGKGNASLVHVFLLDDRGNHAIVSAVGRTILSRITHVLAVVQHLLDTVHALFVEMHIVVFVNFLDSYAHGYSW